MGIHFNYRERGRSEEPVRGVTHLVNPHEDDHEMISGEEDEVERDYLGRLLHVADRALRQMKDGMFHRTRRGRFLH